MKISIEPATIDDAPSLVDIQRRAFKRLYDIYHDEGNPYLRGVDEIARWLERPNWRVYKILADGVLRGGVSFCERDEAPGVYYLARIYIAPEAQGKGIANAAMLLCEQSVANANLWTLDYPANEAINRRSYEKAGYTDTGERREQSGGAITLAYMEKRIPSFRDVKRHIKDPAIRDLLAASVFEPTSEKIAAKIDEYTRNEDWLLYAWAEDGKILGACGFVERSGYIEIRNIAVAENARRRGYATAMINALRDMYGAELRAETDDEAVGFYRKLEFNTTAIYKQYGEEKIRRWACVLPAPGAPS